eukprot:5237547-Pyramimonas_sp.AAC.1
MRKALDARQGPTNNATQTPNNWIEAQCKYGPTQGQPCTMSEETKKPRQIPPARAIFARMFVYSAHAVDDTRRGRRDRGRPKDPSMNEARECSAEIDQSRPAILTALNAPPTR